MPQNETILKKVALINIVKNTVVYYTSRGRFKGHTDLLQVIDDPMYQ